MRSRESPMASSTADGVDKGHFGRKILVTFKPDAYFQA